MKTIFALTTLVVAVSASADYRLSVVARNLEKPTGIAAAGFGRHTVLFITQLPTPGVPGTMGGRNTVDSIFPNGHILNLTEGEPEPTNLAIGSDWNLYWTCKSAGVILRRTPGGSVSPVLTGLSNPSGVAIGRNGLYFTQLPTPGVPGSLGGRNTVDFFNGTSVTNLTTGEPEPTDIAFHRRTGDVYWTCKSAGVILRRNPQGQVSLFLGGLNKPTGIAIDQRSSELVFTEVPTPGVPGSMGGGNFVWKAKLETREREIVNFGDPEPTDVAVAQDGTIYWTCTSAGVVVRATSH